MNNKIKTISYKGSKKLLVEQIHKFALEIQSKTFFDGFSGSGIVSAYMRSKGAIVSANDLNYSSYIYGKVFLEGFEQAQVLFHIKKMNEIQPVSDWITKNYSGLKHKISKRSDSQSGEYPLAFTKDNAMKLDSARNYIESLVLGEKERNALIFSVLLAANSVINNTSDQKSSFKKWLPKSIKPVMFEMPSLIDGPIGTQFVGDIMKIESHKYDLVYLDPPYSNGVLYASCYHINDSIALWDKPELNYNYALPRPGRAVFRDEKKAAGSFYSTKTIQGDFCKLLTNFSSSKRIVISYSDAPKNLIKIDELIDLCKNYGIVSVQDKKHKICTQFKSQKKQIDKLNEYFIIVDNN